jgi:hypothetical protein
MLTSWKYVQHMYKIYQSISKHIKVRLSAKTLHMSRIVRSTKHARLRSSDCSVTPRPDEQTPGRAQHFGQPPEENCPKVGLGFTSVSLQSLFPRRIQDLLNYAEK